MKEEKQMLRKKIKRDSPENKVNDLMEWIFAIRKNKKHQVITKCDLQLI